MQWCIYLVTLKHSWRNHFEVSHVVFIDYLTSFDYFLMETFETNKKWVQNQILKSIFSEICTLLYTKAILKIFLICT